MEASSDKPKPTSMHAYAGRFGDPNFRTAQALAGVRPVGRGAHRGSRPSRIESRQLDSNIPELYSTIMEHGSSEADARLAARLRGLRAERGLTLDGLAERAGVSRSMISLVERGESSPTAAVLHRLAAGLGTTLASLFAEEERPEASPLVRRADQSVWRDPGTGYVRRNLSPPGFPSPIELAEVVLPPGARVAYDAVPGSVGIAQQVWVLEGRIEIVAGEESHGLAEGDCLAMRVGGPTAFSNRTGRPSRHVVALASERAADRAREGGGAGLREETAPPPRPRAVGPSDNPKAVRRS